MTDAIYCIRSVRLGRTYLNLYTVTDDVSKKVPLISGKQSPYGLHAGLVQQGSSIPRATTSDHSNK